jgi:hypothetical protein
MQLDRPSEDTPLTPSPKVLEHVVASLHLALNCHLHVRFI